jgi:hypothetical protein
MNLYVQKNNGYENLPNIKSFRFHKSSSLNNIYTSRYNKRNIEYDLYYNSPLNDNLSFSDNELLPFQIDNDNTIKAYNKYIENKKKIVENNSKNHLLYLSKLFNRNKDKFPFKSCMLGNKKNNNSNYNKMGEFIPKFIKSRHTDINGQQYFQHDLNSKGVLVGETPENSFEFKNFIDNKKKYYLNYNKNYAFGNKKNNSNDDIYNLNPNIFENYKYKNINKNIIPKIKPIKSNEIININISNRSEREGSFKNLPLIKRINFKDNIEPLIKLQYKN